VGKGDENQVEQNRKNTLEELRQYQRTLVSAGIRQQGEER
jgi:hypothetical protein